MQNPRRFGRRTRGSADAKKKERGSREKEKEQSRPSYSMTKVDGGGARLDSMPQGFERKNARERESEEKEPRAMRRRLVTGPLRLTSSPLYTAFSLAEGALALAHLRALMRIDTNT